MLSRWLVALVAAANAWLLPSVAAAHPHVWVTFVSVLLYRPDGSFTGIRSAWTFDEMYSAFATQGLPQKTKGVFTHAELASLADVNVSSLKEFDYFTFATADGKKLPFTDPKDYWLDWNDGLLTLNFTLPLKAPVKAKTLHIEIYDPTYFVDFSLAKQHPVALANAPAKCQATFVRPHDFANGQQLTEQFFNSLTIAQNWGEQFANKIQVKCP
jgi:ABC-type uncharacterized transport system substrate-binding protein